MTTHLCWLRSFVAVIYKQVQLHLLINNILLCFESFFMRTTRKWLLSFLMYGFIEVEETLLH